MHNGAAEFAWPVDRLAEAVEAVAHVSGLVSKGVGAPDRVKQREASSGDSVEGGMERLSRALAFESESADVTYADVDQTLESAGPALLKFAGDEGDRFLILVGSAGRVVKLLAVDGSVCEVGIPIVGDWIKQPLERPITSEVDRLLADSAVPAARWPAARRALFTARIGAITVTRCWMLRPAPAASLWQHMRHARLQRRLLIFIMAYAGAALASAGSWWLIGAAALEGRFDPGTLLAWSFLLLGLVPLSLFAMWSQGVFMVGVSGTLKFQLLAGALKLDPDETRHEGVGHHLARVMESGSLEALAMAGSFQALTALFDLLLAATILIVSSRGLELAALLLFVGLICGVGRVYFRARERWTATRLRLTHDLVEQMVGHRTRLVQEGSVRSHDEEDALLSRYLAVSKRMDRAALALSTAPKIWMVVGLAMLAPQFVAANTTPAVLVVGLAAIMLAAGALTKMTTSLSTLVDAAVSWKQVAPLLEALRRPEPLGHEDVMVERVRPNRSARGSPLVGAQDVAFRFPGGTSSVLSGCSFRISTGDRIHLSGPSGAGKSTLVSMLTGLRAPDSGLLLLDGLDRATLGTKAWRRRVAAAPQFHENHLFSDTLAFNLLMGRRWPPTGDDLRWAETVCRRLGLGELIERMPAGLFQPVGETGWQLSHGERSRIYMARALLQGADLVVLDESFAELDPDSLRRCLPEAAELSKSLLVVAHA